MAGQPEPAESNKKSNKKILIVVGSIVGVLIILSIVGTLLAGYFATKVAETAFETATGSQIDVNGDGSGEVTLAGDNGETMNITTETELPKDFPDLVPLYDNAKLVNATTTSLSEKGTNYSVTFRTGDSVKQVTNYFTDKLSAERGWKINSKRTSGQYTSMMASNEKESVIVMLSISSDNGDEGKTQIHINTRNKIEN